MPNRDNYNALGEDVIHESVWWYERDRFDQHYFGHHGGLTRPEMETVLLAQRYAW